MNKLNTGFSKLPDDAFDNKAQTIVTALTGNAAFPTPSPTLAIVTTALTDYKTALAMPEGTAARTAQVQATRAKLSTLLEQLARNLELTPNVTDAQLATTGYDLHKVPTFTAEPVTAPGNVRLKQAGVGGVVQVMCDAVDRAQAYELQYTLDANAGPWTDGGTFTSTRRIGITGLTRGKDYWARVRAVGPNGPGAWSDPATIMVT